MKYRLAAASFCVAMLIGLPSTHAATTTAGHAFAFGDSHSGKTGRGGTPGPGLIDTSNLGSRLIKRVDGGYHHSLVLADDGTVFSFGSNAFGLTGVGITDGYTFVATPIDTSNLGGRAIKQVAADRSHSLLLAEDGTVFTFGHNGNGMTGLGTASGSTLIATPIDTTNLGGRAIAQVATGSNHSLLLAEDGTVFGFGMDLQGRTGLGNSGGRTTIATPIVTTNLGGRAITQIAAGFSHSLLLADDGTVFSFGNNAGGKTGLGLINGETLIATPIDTSNLGGRAITQIAAGDSHSLLLADDGTVFSMGDNRDFGATGQGTFTGFTTVATPIDDSNLGGRVISQIAVGSLHSLLLADDGALFAFGDNNFGQGALAVDGEVSVASPSNVRGLGDQVVTQIAGGQLHSLLIVIPEPTSMSLLGLGGLAVLRRIR